MNNPLKNELAYVMCLMLPLDIQKMLACSLIMYYKRVRVKTKILCDSINQINKYIDHMAYHLDTRCYSPISINHSRQLKNVSKQYDHIFRVFNLRLSEYNTPRKKYIKITFYRSIPNVNRVYIYHSLFSGEWKFLTVLNCIHYSGHMNYYQLRPIYTNIIITRNPIHIMNGRVPSILDIMTETGDPVLSFKTNEIIGNEIEISSFIQYKMFINETYQNRIPINQYQQYSPQHKLYNIDIPDYGEYVEYVGNWKNLRHYEFNDFRSKYIDALKLTKYKNQYIKKHHKSTRNTIYNVNHEITEYKTALKHTVTTN